MDGAYKKAISLIEGIESLVSDLKKETEDLEVFECLDLEDAIDDMTLEISSVRQMLHDRTVL